MRRPTRTSPRPPRQPDRRVGIGAEQVVADRAALDAAEQKIAARFADGAVPRPPFWGGYRLVPTRVEFWQGRINRLHDRLRYTRRGEGWDLERLAP